MCWNSPEKSPSSAEHILSDSASFLLYGWALIGDADFRLAAGRSMGRRRAIQWLKGQRHAFSNGELAATLLFGSSRWAIFFILDLPGEIQDHREWTEAAVQVAPEKTVAANKWEYFHLAKRGGRGPLTRNNFGVNRLSMACFIVFTAKKMDPKRVGRYRPCRNSRRNSSWPRSRVFLRVAEGFCPHGFFVEQKMLEKGNKLQSSTSRVIRDRILRLFGVAAGFRRTLR